MCGGYMEPDLSKAIEEMKEGRGEGFNKLYSATYQRVYFRARQCTKTAEDAEDVTQITFIEAYKNIGKLQTSEAALSWLYTICYNQACEIHDEWGGTYKEASDYTLVRPGYEYYK